MEFIHPLYDRLLLEYGTDDWLEILRCALDIVLGPSDSFPLDQDLEAFPVIPRKKCLFDTFSLGHKGIQALGFRFLRNLIRELSGRHGIMVVMGGEWECMELRDPICPDKPERIPEIRIGFTRKPDYEVRSDIHLHSVLPFEGSEFSQDLQEFRTVVVAVHGLQDTIRTGLDREVYVGAQTPIPEKLHEPMVDKFDTQARHTESRDGGFIQDLPNEFMKTGVQYIL